MLPVHIWGNTVFALLDSGATGTYMSRDLWEKLSRGRMAHSLNAYQNTVGPRDAQGGVVHGVGTAKIPVALGGATRCLPMLITDRLHPALIIGLEADSPETGVRNVWHRKVRRPDAPLEGVAVLTEPVWIPAHGGKNIWLQVPDEEEGTLGIVRMERNENAGVGAPMVLVRTVMAEGKCWVPIACDNENGTAAVLFKPGEAEFIRGDGRT